MEILISKNNRQVAKIVFDDKFPTKQEINVVLKKFGHGEYELTAPNGRKWRVVKEDVISYLMKI